MNRQQARETEDYKQAYKKIESYPKGFTFTINFSDIPKPKANALHLLLTDATLNGILESKSFGLDLEGNIVEETFIKL